eukprot:6460434-Amphidinium_carterae.1
MSSSSFSCTAGIVEGSTSFSLNSARLPCSALSGLPLPGLFALCSSLCLVPRTGMTTSERTSWCAVWFVAGTPGATSGL